MRREFFKTVVQVVILSEDDPWDGELSDLHQDVTDGDCSGAMIVKSSKEVTGLQMARLLRKQGSEPGFFRIDDKGKDIDEE